MGLGPGFFFFSSVTRACLYIHVFTKRTKTFTCLKSRLYALSLPLGVYLPLGVNICPTLLNTPVGKRLRIYVF